MYDYSEKTCKAKEITFNREKIASMMKISKRCISDIEIKTYQTSEDYITDKLTVQLEAFIYSNTIDERKLEYYLERPSFLDWLLRRRKKVMFDFKAKDLMLDAPIKNKDKFIRIYEIGDGSIIL